MKHLQFNYIIVEDIPIQQERLKTIIDNRYDWDSRLLGAFEDPQEAYQFLKASHPNSLLTANAAHLLEAIQGSEAGDS